MIVSSSMPDESKMCLRALKVLVQTEQPALQHQSKQGRYHLLDPFHRFYLRFLQPREAEISYQPDNVLAEIQADLRAFVGQTAWEELARTWVFRQGIQGRLIIGGIALLRRR